MFFPEQVPTEPRAERATSEDGGNADGGPDRSTSGSDPALPPVHMDPTPQMRETPSHDISDDLSRRFVRLESLVEMIDVHVGLVEPEDLFTTPEDLSAASEPAIPIGDEGENVHENEATPSIPPRKKRKLPLVVNLIEVKTIIYFFYHLDQVHRLFLSMILYPSM